jgi:hypothetical protein
VEALGQEIESTQRALELVEATEEQLAAQEAEYQEDEGHGPEASTQVRGLAKASDHQRRVAHLGLVSVL